MPPPEELLLDDLPEEELLDEDDLPEDELLDELGLVCPLELLLVAPLLPPLEGSPLQAVSACDHHEQAQMFGHCCYRHNKLLAESHFNVPTW